MRRKNVFIVGNCQASAIANLYRNFVGLPNYESVTYFDDHMIAPEVTRAAVAAADLVIVQDRDFNHGISQESLSAGAAVVNFPMVLAGFVWPYANEAHVLNVPEPPFSDGPYPSQLSDSFLNRLIIKGATPEQALEDYLALDIARAAHLDRMAEIYFAKQRDRDSRTGFDIAPQIEQRFRDEALFRTPHHPNAALFGVVASQLFARLGVSGDVIDAALRSLITTPFPSDELPIHPGVIRHFGLSFADETTRYSYFDEGRFTFEEYVLRYMRYENNYALRLGIATAEGGDPNEVIALLDDGLARSPGSMRGWRARGIALDRLGNHHEACNAFQRAIDVDPESPEGLIALSVSHRMAGEQDAALSAAERAVTLAPSYYLAHRVLAEAQMAAGAASTDAAHMTARLLPSATNLHLLGLATAASGGLELAEDAARRLLAMDPTSPDARNLLAETLEDRSRRYEAIAVLTEGAALGVENGQTYSLLGNFYWRDGNLAAAEAAFQRGSEMEPTRVDLLKCRDDVRAQRANSNEAESPAESARPAAAPTPPSGSDRPVRAQPLRTPARRLRWLPPMADWAARIGDVERQRVANIDAWASIVKLAQHDLDFVRTSRLDSAIGRLFGTPLARLDTAPVRLAVLGSSTVDHLLPALRVAAARRGLALQTYVPAYGQFRQDILDPTSGLHAFNPTAVLFALDAHYFLQGADPAMDRTEAQMFVQNLLGDLDELWTRVRTAFRPQILQNAVLPIFPPLLGLNEHRLAGSAAALTRRLAVDLADAADAAGVDLVAIDQWAAQDGLGAWHDPVLWHRAKQEISPLAAPVYGDLVARLLAAARGLSAKCLVLDLDNTLWGGVVGDEGPEGIVIGHGSAAGEAFAAFQSFALAMRKRGVLLAVCSKNDEHNARAAFEQNTNMVLKLSDFSAFVANWNDKASNLQHIAAELNIGLEALVFVDDNPFERDLVRRELPQVHVPEMPDEPAAFAATLSDAGYFEGLSLTLEDRERTMQYEANRVRAAVAAKATDLESYLRGLDMRLLWKPIDRAGLRRATQLINKTNQFNLTTRRYTEDEVATFVEDPNAIGLQMRLLDRFGDNGVIAVVLGRINNDALEIDSWLMSCRVLGRQVEQGTHAILVGEASRLGATTLLGRYRPSSKNGMVENLLPRLGFSAVGHDGEDYLYRAQNPIAASNLPMTIEKDAA